MRRCSPNASDLGLANILRWPTERSRNWTRGLVNSARASRGIMAVAAIGSAVRPNLASADLDLIVIRADAEIFVDAAPMEVDLRVYSAADVDAQIGGGNDLLGWAVKFGRALFQRDQYWDELVNSWYDRLPLPSPAISRARAANAYRRLAKVLAFGDADAAQEQAVSYLTHLARAELLEKAVYPASRPELPAQLRATGNFEIAEGLDRFLRNQSPDLMQIHRLLKIPA